MQKLAVVAAVSLSLSSATSAHALCVHAGKLGAETSLAEEYRESRWVVKARVVSAEDHWSTTSDSWTIYRLQVLAVFKGRTGQRLSLFTRRDSGGFYLDKGAEHDIGGAYILFLVPASSADAPTRFRGMPVVNYACGQSKPWPMVSKSELFAHERFDEGSSGSRAKPPLP
jgi:hypothetical protein